MDKVGYGQVILKKGKKKQAKDELDRQKQAEKKKRRLEKALATSAAIRSELEKKKQKKKEEQQRIDEEGAAIAEAVALQVLIGEDNEESCYNTFMGYRNFSDYSFEGLRWPANEYRPGYKWNEWEIGNFHSPYYEETRQGAQISAGLMAAQAVASLQIAEDSNAANFYKEF